MSNETLIPADTHVAAKRAFIRTTAQAYATSFAGGISTSALLSMMTGELDWTQIIVIFIVVVFSPLLAGLVAYLDYISKGIPEEYQPELVLEYLPIANPDVISQTTDQTITDL